MKQENREIKRLAWRPVEVASMFGFSLSFIRNEIRAGNLKATKFGRAVVIFDEDLAKYKNRYRIDDRNRN